VTGLTQIENNRIIIDLTQAALSTGWSVNGSQADHVQCNAGDIFLLGYPLVVGQSYRYTVQATVSSGYLQAMGGVQHTTGGFIEETIVATGTQFFFYANGNCTIQDFVIEAFAPTVSIYEQSAVAFSERLNKWTSFYTKRPESAYSMYKKTYEWLEGDVYLVESGSNDRCKFFGVQYPATIWFSTNQQPTLAKTFMSINYQASQLLITPPSGVYTSTGQYSELIEQDFLQDTLNNGDKVYFTEGLAQAYYMRAIPDMIEGQQLKGNYLEMGLQTTSPSSILTLFSTEIGYVHSYQNIR